MVIIENMRSYLNDYIFLKFRKEYHHDDKSLYKRLQQNEQ